MLKNLDGINNSADPLIVNSVIFNLLKIMPVVIFQAILFPICILISCSHMFNSNLRKKLLNNKKIIITEYWERWHAVSPNLNCSVKLSKKNCKYPGKILLMVLSFIQLYAYPLACLACLWPYTAPHSVFEIAIPSLLQCHFLV